MKTESAPHPLAATREPFRDALLALDSSMARQILLESATELGSLTCLEQVVVPVLEQMGRDWEEGKLALSQIYMAGRICEALVDELLPAASPQRQHQPRTALVVLEDYHMLGKRLVHAAVRASGFEVLDYGRMQLDSLVERVRREQVEILLVSTLMLPSALRVEALTQALKVDGPRVRVVVGGAPFRYDAQLWRRVGADAMGQSAADAVAIVGRLSGGTE